MFNQPHSSDMGGSWDRLRVARRILESVLLEHVTQLTAEVTAIVNARPLVPVSNDPENPIILTLSMQCYCNLVSRCPTSSRRLYR